MPDKAVVILILMILAADLPPADCMVTMRLCGHKLVNMIKHLCNYKNGRIRSSKSPALLI